MKRRPQQRPRPAFLAFQDLAYGLTSPLAGLLAERAGYSGVFLAGGVCATLGLLIALRQRGAVLPAFR